MTTRSATVVLVTGLLALSASAQDQAPPKVPTHVGDATLHHEPAREVGAVQWSLWMALDPQIRSVDDVRAHLEELQRRFEKQPVRIGVVLQDADAKALAATAPRFTVVGTEGSIAVPSLATAVITDATGSHVAELSLDYAEDVLAALLDGKAVETIFQSISLAENQLATVGDAEAHPPTIAELLAALPHSGRVRALAVLEPWWCRGEHAPALEALDTGLRELAGHTYAMAQFVDLVGRGDDSDPAVRQRLAVEMAPVAAAAGDDPFVQLVFLRSLLRANRMRLAERVTKRLDAQLQKRGDPWLRLQFAEVLMDAKDPRSVRALAQAHLDAIADGAMDLEATAMVRHKLLRRCGDAAAAAALLKQFLPDESASGLNNHAWYACVRLDSMGRFPDWANDLADRMLGSDRERLESNYRDTVALAFFCAGRVEAAAEQQTIAIGEHQGDPRYAGRLKRYEETLARQKRVPPPPSPK